MTTVCKLKAAMADVLESAENTLTPIDGADAWDLSDATATCVTCGDLFSLSVSSSISLSDAQADR